MTYEKGIVESGVKYVKGNFLPLREFRDLADLNRQAMDWVLETAGSRIHGTTRERPLTRFAEVEKDFLKLLPVVPPEAAAWTRLKVHGNCHVAFEKCYYSASFTLVHQVVWLRATEKGMHINHLKQLVAMHPLMPEPHPMREAPMQPMPQLLPLLEQLRLSGILNSLEVRNRQALEQKLPYMEFLALLIGDELARREGQKFAQRQRRAHLNAQKTIETFDFCFNPGVDQTRLRDLATCRFLEEKAPVLIMGPCGTGKSHLAQALGHMAMRRGCDVVFAGHAKLLGQLTASKAVGGFERKLSRLAKADLLIVDDFGLKPIRPGRMKTSTS